MLWATSLSFLWIAYRCFKRKKKSGPLMFALGISSVLHHGNLANVRILDKFLAHITALFGILHGIKDQQWHLLPHAIWNPAAYYFLQPIVPDFWKDVLHGTIHISTAYSFDQI